MENIKYHVIIEAGPDDCMALQIKDCCFGSYAEAKEYYEQVLSTDDTYFKDIYHILSPYIDDEEEFDEDDDEDDDVEEDDDDYDDRSYYFGYEIFIVKSPIEIFETPHLRGLDSEPLEYGEWYQEFEISYDNKNESIFEIYSQHGGETLEKASGVLMITTEEIKESM